MGNLDSKKFCEGSDNCWVSRPCHTSNDVSIDYNCIRSNLLVLYSNSLKLWLLGEVRSHLSALHTTSSYEYLRSVADGSNGLVCFKEMLD